MIYINQQNSKKYNFAIKKQVKFVKNTTQNQKNMLQYFSK